MKTTVLSVTQLNTYAKSLIEGDMNLRSLYVTGEISNFKNHYATGHFYMTLKDEKCAIRAVMFRSANQKLRFAPEDGMKVICRGRVSIFERDGSFQLYIEDMQPDGAGALSIAFEQLKNKLAQEGLFDEDFKKPIPSRCYRIGVVTSATGAVLQDIRNVVSRRFPLAEIILADVQVQGPMAAGQIANAINMFNSGDYADVLIVGRGGGSLEDLWAFNEEIVARAVFDSVVPVISAVGHETDFTICDFVSDLRAPTPSAAAELAVPDIRDDIDFISAVRNQCEATLLERIYDEEKKLEIIKERLKYRSPVQLIDERIQMTDNLLTKALVSIENRIAKENARLSALAAGLDALSPLKVMSRGYSFVKKDDKVITKACELDKGDRLNIAFADGEIECEVL